MVGIVFGCFCPMHQGHLDLIMRAKKENDLCLIVCSGYDNDRGSTFLPIEKRFRYVSEFFSDDELVKVIKVNDSEIGIKDKKVENWGPWIEEIKRQMSALGLGDKKYKFYVSESDYHEELTKYYNEEVQLCERANPISGTMIRNNPIKYWNKIVPTFRRAFSNNILVIGTSSEGKTHLVNDISKYFSLVHSYEKGRDSVIFKDDTELDCDDFVFNIYEQNKLNKSLINSRENNGVFISDTDNLVTLMYAKDYAEKKGFKLTMDDYENVLLPLAKSYAKSIRWDKIFVLPPHENFVDDGVRCMLNSGIKERKRLYEILKDLLVNFNYDYEELEGTYYENFLRVKEYIENIREKDDDYEKENKGISKRRVY